MIVINTNHHYNTLSSTLSRVYDDTLGFGLVGHFSILGHSITKIVTVGFVQRYTVEPLLVFLRALYFANSATLAPSWQ